MNEDKIIRTMRLQAWERAKGELNAVLQTYWGNTNNYCAMHDEIDAFIDKVNKRGLVE
jgi:hypothetical protein